MNHIMHLFILFSICSVHPIKSTNTKTEEVTIFSISNYDDYGSQSIIGAQWLAIHEINANSHLLPNYQLKMQPFNSRSHRQIALLDALNITNKYQYDMDRNHTYFPISLAAPWSSLSTATSPIFGAFNMGQISASSTSIVLSETTKYPHFYRTVPSDALQAAGIIHLCDTFDWRNVAVVYVNDAWGLYLSLGIQELSKQHGIDITAIAVSEHDAITHSYAAKQIKDLNIFVTVLIIHDTNIGDLLQVFNNEGIIGYPYFYIGTDGWFDLATISQFNLETTELIGPGWIGTVPWQGSSLPLNEYTEDIQSIVNTSLHLHNNFLTKWDVFYHNEYADELFRETPGFYSGYGYDAVYSLAYAMQYIEDHPDEYDGQNMLDIIHNQHASEVIELLNTIITTKIDFIGLTGRILFDECGDRLHGFFSFSNILQDGTTDYVGYFYNNVDGNISYKLDVSKIEWPQEFVSKGIIPRTSNLMYEEMISVPRSTSIAACAASLLSILYAAFCIGLSIYYRKRRIIKAASWRLNIIICLGATLGYIRSIIYLIDEELLAAYDEQSQQNILDVACNLRVWVTTIAFTLVFMPLFAKTYRLSKIFDGFLSNKSITDKTLFLLIVISVIIDIVLLMTLTLVLKPLQRIYLSGNITTIDALREIQYIYGSCSFDGVYFSATFWYFYGSIALWKLFQALWGIHVALNVSRVRGRMLQQLMQFDETASIVFSIMFTLVVIAIAVPVWVFGILTERILIHYYVFVVAIVLIGNVVISVNLLPRLWAVITGNEDRFNTSPSEQLGSAILKQLVRVAKEQKWCEMNQTPTGTGTAAQFPRILLINDQTNSVSMNTSPPNPDKIKEGAAHEEEKASEPYIGSEIHKYMMRSAQDSDSDTDHNNQHLDPLLEEKEALTRDTDTEADSDLDIDANANAPTASAPAASYNPLHYA